MKQVINKLSLSSKKFDQRHVQLFLVILTLLMLVLGAGAPGTMGGR